MTFRERDYNPLIILSEYVTDSRDKGFIQETYTAAMIDG